jgi:hypothetical protein
MDDIDLEILRAQGRRMYRMGGRAPARWVVTLAALACGVGPMLPLLPIGTWHVAPRLAYLPFTPLVTDLGIPISALLAIAFSRRWAGIGRQRYAVIIAVLTAAVLRTALYATTVGFTNLPVQMWELGHLISAVLVTWAIIWAMSIGGFSHGPAKSRPLSSGILGHAHRDHPPGETVSDYKLSSMSRRRSSYRGSGEAA